MYGVVAARHPEAAVVVPPRKDAVLSEMAETAPTRRDRHLRSIAEHGRMGWQKGSRPSRWWRFGVGRQWPSVRPPGVELQKAGLV
jgi:hypothetical protein